MRRIGYQSLTACCTAALALLAADRATAQNTCWRVTDVTALNGAPVGDRQIPGINAAGEVVGSFKVNGEWHAFVWLPVANPSYPALLVGLNDLHVLAGLAPGDSAARSINDSGFVAGERGGFPIHQRRAIVMDLTQPGIPVINVPVPLADPMDPNSGPASGGAWAINNANPFQVVGQFVSADECTADETRLDHGFIWESGAASVTVLLDGALTEHNFLALGVNTPAAGNAALITGQEAICFVQMLCPAFTTRQIGCA